MAVVVPHHAANCSSIASAPQWQERTLGDLSKSTGGTDLIADLVGYFTA